MNRAMQLLGLAMRAGYVVTGEERVLRSIRSDEANLVLIATDAGKNTRKTLVDKARTYDVPIIHRFDRHTLGKAIGKGDRVAVAVNEAGFAAQLLKLSQL